ncbi:MAG: hypothetical protein ACLR23_21330 [Clostridia bacterium]
MGASYINGIWETLQKLG